MSKLVNKSGTCYRRFRGIGAAIAKRLAADGASVASTYAKDASAASTVVKAIEPTAERLSRFKRMLPILKLSRARSKRRSRNLAGWMCS